jgi:hypothetical protein
MAKALVARVWDVANKIVHQEQTHFLLGWFILDTMLLAWEVVDWLKLQLMVVYWVLSWWLGVWKALLLGRF